MTLSTDPTSAANAFQFLFLIRAQAQAQKVLEVQARVCRCPDAAQIFFRTGDKLYYGIMADGLVVMADPESHGTVVVWRGRGAFDLEWGPNRNDPDKYGFDLSYSSKLTHSIIRLDLGGLLRGAIAHAIDQSLDPNTNILRITTKHGDVVCRLPAATLKPLPPVAVQEFAQRTDDLDTAVAISSQSPMACNAAHLTNRDLVLAGLRARPARPGERLSWLLPPQFGADPQDRVVSDRFSALLNATTSCPPTAAPVIGSGRQEGTVP